MEDIEALKAKYASRIKQMRNLALFRDKTEEEIIEWILKREERQKLEPKKEKVIKQPEPETKLEDVVPKFGDSVTEDEKHERLFQEKLTGLQKEYGIDMNNSNDAEMLKALTRHIIQQEIVDRQIIRLQREPELDTRTLKNLGDYQRSVVATITDLQEKLGISRRQRKEKQVDSIPQFVDLTRKNARIVWERRTVPVKCQTCEIELARTWLNFPKEENRVNMELTCWKCKELVLFKI